MSGPVSQGTPSNPVLGGLARRVGEIGELQSKLILLVGNGGKATTFLLRLG